MVDNLTPEKRSWVMSRVKSKNTKPELIVRSLLHGMGYRFTVNGPLNRKLPGHPDIVLPKYRTVVFVNGCFWHQHRGCKGATMPTTRRKYWQRKLEANMARDKKSKSALVRAGWRVCVIWECVVTSRPKIVARLLKRVIIN